MPGKLLNAELIQQIKLLFDTQLIYPVELLYFYEKDQCNTCDEMKQLLDEITSISQKLSLSIYEIHENPQLAHIYNVRITPGMVITGRDQDELLDNGIRFTGIPSGYEFSSLIHANELVSKRDSGIKPEIRNELKGLHVPVRLQVLVTPT